MKSLAFKWKKNRDGKVNTRGEDAWYIVPSSMRMVRDNPEVWSGDDVKIYELLFKQDRRLKKFEKKRGIYWMPSILNIMK